VKVTGRMAYLPLDSSQYDNLTVQILLALAIGPKLTHSCPPRMSGHGEVKFNTPFNLLASIDSLCCPMRVAA